ncbi:MAG: outer membrane lipoprotein chaperone LolA [Pseudomonadales bacterium]|nr:outer membrane lipoprotein chaperone LolA [Pseudomonadales bacterium]MCP5331491.1 outer membrane lipoprotein chaperone LolA [Pseudomonadales bacterium]MCP5343374.1 outer membrane lipoprotein chaperone LolA [Pseudomonadales bacterium]
MTLRPIRLMLCAAVLLWPWTGSVAQDEAAAQLGALLEGIETYQADVRQLIVESSGGVLEESGIRFMLKRPNGFYWETLEPYPELIVTDGRQLWNYQPDLLQVTIEDWDNEHSELAAQLLNGRIDEIEQDYFINGGRVGDGNAYEFILEPVDPASLYERVTLYFRDNSLGSIHIDNGNGQRTFWEFFNAQVNAPIDDSAFVFTAPEDIEIIDNRGAP